MSVTSSIGSFFGSIGSTAKALVAALGRWFNSLFQDEQDLTDNIASIVDDFHDIVANVEAEIEKLKNFNFDPHWRTRVINVPVAIDQTRALIEKVTLGFRDRLTTIITPVKDFRTIIQHEADPDPLGDKPSGITKSVVKIHHIVVLVGEVRKSLDAIKDFSQLFKEITDAIEGLDTLFLSQGRAQKKSTKTGRFRV